MKRILLAGLFLLAFAAPSWATISCTIWVDSTKTGGADDGTSRTDAFLTLEQAFTGWGTSDIICVLQQHAESLSAHITLDSASDAEATPIPVYSVDNSTDTYAIASTAQVETTTGGWWIYLNTQATFYGIYFKVGDNILINATANARLVDCTVELVSADGIMQAVGDGTVLSMKGGKFICTHASGCYIQTDDELLLMEGVEFTGAVGSGLFRGTAAGASHWVCKGCNFAGLDSGSTLADVSSWGNGHSSLEITGSTRHATVTIDDDGWDRQRLQYVYLSGTDDTTDDEGFRQEWYGYNGDVTTDTGVYHDAGLVFAEGTTNASIKFVTAAHVSEWEELCSWPTSEWINTTGSKTWTTEVVENFTSALTTAEVWQEIFYLGTSGSPLWELDLGQSVGSTTALATGTGLANWTGEPAGSRSAKLTTTATVNKAGIYQIRYCVGAYEAGKVVHIDPKPSIS